MKQVKAFNVFRVTADCVEDYGYCGNCGAMVNMALIIWKVDMSGEDMIFCPVCKSHVAYIEESLGKDIQTMFSTDKTITSELSK